MRVNVFLLAALTATSLHAESADNLAVFGVLQGHDPSLSSMELIHRAPVTPELDLVIARGGHDRWRPGMPRPVTDTQLGLFLQDRARPALVHALTIQKDSASWGCRIERATVTDTVIACTGEKSEKHPNEKFVYDVRARALVSHFSYAPFFMIRMFPTPGGAVIVGSDRQRLLAVEFDPARTPPLRVMGDAEALPWTRRIPTSETWEGHAGNRFLHVVEEGLQPLRFGDARQFTLCEALDEDDGYRGPVVIDEVRAQRFIRHALLQSTHAEFANARPEELANIGGPEHLEIEEVIGPHQIEGDRLWFGKEFYDSEGMSGIGGFGYFYGATRVFRLFAPPEILDWSVAALHVDPDAIWMALVTHQEWGPHGGGILRYDRASGSVRKLELPDIGQQFLRVGDQLVLATDAGIAVVTGDQVSRFIVDRMTDGRIRVAAAEREPPAASRR